MLKNIREEVVCLNEVILRQTFLFNIPKFLNFPQKKHFTADKKTQNIRVAFEGSRAWALL